MYHPHERVQLHPGVGRTKQSFAEESNINIIMKRYEKTGMLEHLNTHQGEYGNFIAAPDYHTAMNRIREAGEMFMSIPAGVRARFDNDPAQFLAFVQDPKNKGELVTLGLAVSPRPGEPVEASPEPEDPPPAKEEPDGDD